MERIESGAVQLGDDWPGVFFRGDEAARLRLILEQAQPYLDTINSLVAQGYIEWINDAFSGNSERVTVLNVEEVG